MKEKFRDTQVEIPKIRTLQTQKERIIPYGTNILINDIGADENWKDECKRMLQPSIEFVAPQELSDNLGMTLNRECRELAEKKVAVLFPGRGGVAVQESIDRRNIFPNVDYQEFRVGATRSFPRAIPAIILPEVLIESLRQRIYDTILVVDDVIVTGETLKAVQQKIYLETDEVNYEKYNQSLRFSWSEVEINRLPLSWYAASWLTSAKPKTQATTLSEYQQVLTCLYYKGERGQTPVNSLSTWVLDEIKGQKVLEAYAKKYATDPQAFVKFIVEFKGGEK